MSDGRDHKAEPGPKSGDARQERLVKALRANLRRRKDGPAREAQTPSPDDCGEDPGPQTAD
jgi:hypothetical protein